MIKFLQYFFFALLLSLSSYTISFATGSKDACLGDPLTLNYSSTNYTSCASFYISAPNGYVGLPSPDSSAGNHTYNPGNAGAVGTGKSFVFNCSGTVSDTTKLNVYVCSCSGTNSGTACPNTIPTPSDALTSTPAWTNAGSGSASCGTTKCSYFALNDQCGPGSSATPVLSEPTGASACAGGTLNSSSPADTTTAWNWSCGTVTTCTAPKYGCTNASDTNFSLAQYGASGPNNTFGCSGSCVAWSGTKVPPETGNVCSYTGSTPAIASPGNYTIPISAPAGYTGSWPWSCVNSGGGTWTAGTAICTAPGGISVSISASPASMTLPTNGTRLTWTITGSPTSCTASNDWTGAKSTVSGSIEDITSMTAGTSNFIITCSKSGVSDVTSNVNVVVSPASTGGTWSADGNCPSACGYAGANDETWTCSGGSCTPATHANTWCNATAPCVPNTDCIGSWGDNSTCSVTFAVNKCGQSGTYQQTFTQSVAQSGTGKSCTTIYGGEDAAKKWGTTACSTRSCNSCTGLWGGTNVVSGGTATAYESSVVNAPVNSDASCTSQTRTCYDGSWDGTYTNQSCYVKKAAITIPASCVVLVGNSTCTVNASWTSQNLSSPRFYDKNMNNTLSNAENGGPTLVWIAYGGTTFAVTDSTNYEYANKPVTADCETGTHFMPLPSGTGNCEYDVTSTFSASPPFISYEKPSVTGYSSTLTWTSSHATECTAGGAWSNLSSPLGDKFNGSGSTGGLSSGQEYTFFCTGLGIPPVPNPKSVTVSVCPSITPISMSSIRTDCRTDPGVSLSLRPGNGGQYTPTGTLLVGVTDAISGATSCELYYDEVTRSADGKYSKTGRTISLGSVSHGSTPTIGESGDYYVLCKTLSADGHIFKARNQQDVEFRTEPPFPIISLKATPATISKGVSSVVSWTVTYPNPVQKKPARAAFCTLAATAICTNNKCTTEQHAEEVAANLLLNGATGSVNNQIGVTDTNDSGGSGRTIKEALNTIFPPYDLGINDGETKWKAIGKKTFPLKASMSFHLDCGVGPHASSTVRVLVTTSNEG